MNLLKKKSSSTLEHNIYINNINGMLQAFCLNLVAPFAGLYAKRLNASDNDIAMLNSYPAIFCLLAMFLGTYLFRKYRDKKKLTTIFFALSRSFFLLFVFVQFAPKTMQSGLFVLLYGAMNFPNSIAIMGWQSYIGDLFSNTWRGRAFSKRSSLATISAFVVTLATGAILRYFPSNDADRLKYYQFFFILAFITAIFEIYSFTLHKLDKCSVQVEKVTEFEDIPFFEKIKKTYTIVIANKKFLDFCICAVIFHFAWQMGWPLFFSYEVDVLHTNEGWAAIEGAIGLIFQAITYGMWQKKSEKKGNNYTIFLACFAMALCPFFYTISRSMYHVLIFTIVTGSAVSGTLLLLLNNLYETAPDENRTLYIAIYTVLTNITLMIAPILGMKIKNMLNIYYALIIVGILRLIAAFIFYLRYKKYKSA